MFLKGAKPGKLYPKVDDSCIIDLTGTTLVVYGKRPKPIYVNSLCCCRTCSGGMFPCGGKDYFNFKDSHRFTYNDDSNFSDTEAEEGEESDRGESEPEFGDDCNSSAKSTDNEMYDSSFVENDETDADSTHIS